MLEKDFDISLLIFNKFKDEFKNYKEFQKKFLNEFKEMKKNNEIENDKRIIEIQAKQNILDKKILEATEIIAKSEKILNEKEQKLIDKINPNILLWKNRKKIIEILDKLIKFGLKIDIEKFTIAFQDIDVNSVQINDISKIIPLILDLLKDKQFEEIFIELIGFISKNTIDIDNLSYFDIFDLFKGFFLFFKNNMN